MKSSKLSTVFLLLIMVFTLTMSVGCGKENSDPKDNGEEKNPSEVVGNENLVVPSKVLSIGRWANGRIKCFMKRKHAKFLILLV